MLWLKTPEIENQKTGLTSVMSYCFGLLLLLILLRENITNIQKVSSFFISTPSHPLPITPHDSSRASQFIWVSFVKYLYFLQLNGANKGFSKIQFASSQFSISPSKTHLLRKDISLLSTVTKTRHSKKEFLIFAG